MRSTNKTIWILSGILIIFIMLVTSYFNSTDSLDTLKIILLVSSFFILIIIYVIAQSTYHGISFSLNRKKEIVKLIANYELDNKSLDEFNKSLKSAHLLINLLITKSNEFIYSYSKSLNHIVYTEKIMKNINNFANNKKGGVFIICEENIDELHKLSDYIQVKKNFKIDNLKHFLITDYGMRVELKEDLKNKITEGIIFLNIKDSRGEIKTKYKKYKEVFEENIK